MSKIWWNKIHLAANYFVVTMPIFHYCEHIFVTATIIECSRQVTQGS